MKIINLDKDAEEKLAYNAKKLQDFVDAYKIGNCRGFVAFRIDKSCKKLDQIFSWDEGGGASILGALEIVKHKILEDI